MEIVLVAAVSRTGCIGAEGTVPWDYPADFDQYKRRVRGQPVVVGRRTFDSTGPIEDSLTLVVTRDESRSSAHGRVEWHTSRRGVIDRAQRAGADRLSVIGGAEIYRLFAPAADRAFVSELPETLEGDAYFPYLGAGWERVSVTAYDRFEVIEYENTTPISDSEL